MSHTITASFESMIQDAFSTANIFLRSAIKNIDGYLGDKYASKNPDLIVAYMNVAVQDLTNAMRFLAAQLDRDSAG